MRDMRILAWFTLREVLGLPIYRILYGLSFALIMIAMIVSNLFLFETSKVLIDLIWLSMGIITFIYALFIACHMLAQDIGHQMVYLFIPQLNRSSYLLGRLLGLGTAFILLVLWLCLLATIAIAWKTHSTLDVYHHGIYIWTALPLSFVSILQGCVYIALIAFVCSWATSQAEMLVFSSAFIVLSSIFPSIIEILQSPDIIQNTPTFIVWIIQALSFLFPKLSASSFAIAQAHGITIPLIDWFAFIASNIGYIILILYVAFFMFSRRDL